MTPDEQEAESVKYALGIRVIKLTSGSWAYFQDFRLLAITLTLETTRLEFMLSAQLVEYEASLRRPARKISGAELLKELGL